MCIPLFCKRLCVLLSAIFNSYLLNDGNWNFFLGMGIPTNGRMPALKVYLFFFQGTLSTNGKLVV